MVIDEALEAALLEWYGDDWRNRFFLRRREGILGAQDAMRRAIEAANIVTFRKMRGLDAQPAPEAPAERFEQDTNGGTTEGDR